MARIVEAVGSAAPSGVTGSAIEKAMAEAGLAAMAEGITDPDEIRARKLAAREAIKNPVAENDEPQR